MNWTRNDTKRTDSPNLLAMIDQFNRLGQWVVSLLVTTQDLEKRVKYLQRIIQVGHELFKLKNFNSTMAIVSGLKNSSIVRLKQTWVSTLNRLEVMEFQFNLNLNLWIMTIKGRSSFELLGLLGGNWERLCVR
jgi:hypothetical protein